ncbi:hypothetical protein [Streptomyces marincola]|uniref:hypothetical protein n=1 Tax=Streptomyces marincola TaxID=2878388 RepID=UPI001CF46F74|nr:hypothetical protein [Streptomyces marincola]UCM87289.1 hypothetical protein LC193_04650 [Streptomyces marincola]
MSTEAALALVSAAAGSVATEAGRHAWDSLLALARRVTGRAGADPVGPVDPVDPADETAVRELTGRIADRAASDEEFAAELRQWAQRHRGAVEVGGTRVQNTVADGAQVRNLLQTGTVHGDIHFGA